MTAHNHPLLARWPCLDGAPFIDWRALRWPAVDQVVVNAHASGGRTLSTMRERLHAIITATAPPVPARPEPGAPQAEHRRWLWRRAQHGWPAAYPLAQFPNAPLILSFAASLVVSLLSSEARPYGQAASSLFLFVWAWLELSAGVNLLRRIVGLTFIVTIIAGIGSKIG